MYGKSFMAKQMREIRLSPLVRDDDRVYRNAMLGLLQHHPCLFNSPAGLQEIKFRNHERDEEGRLVSVEAYIEE